MFFPSFFNFVCYMITNSAGYNKWLLIDSANTEVKKDLCCPAIRRKQSDLLNFWQSVPSWNAVDGYEFYQRRVRMPIDVAGTMVNYGKLSVITQSEMVISVTLNITNVEEN